MKSRNEIQQEIIDSLSIPSHGLLQLSPRIGKTKLGIDIISLGALTHSSRSLNFSLRILGD